MEAVINRHLKDFCCDFTLEFDVRNYSGTNLSEEAAEHEFETGHFTNLYSDKCFREIMKARYSWVKDWFFAGRSNGWWVLACTGDHNKIPQRSLWRIESIVEKYLKNYGTELEKFYSKELVD